MASAAAAIRPCQCLPTVPRGDALDNASLVQDRARLVPSAVACQSWRSASAPRGGSGMPTTGLRQPPWHHPTKASRRSQRPCHVAASSAAAETAAVPAVASARRHTASDCRSLLLRRDGADISGCRQQALADVSRRGAGHCSRQYATSAARDAFEMRLDDWGEEDEEDEEDEGDEGEWAEEEEDEVEGGGGDEGQDEADVTAPAAIAVGVEGNGGGNEGIISQGKDAVAAVEARGEGEVQVEAKDKGEEYSAVMQFAMANTSLVYRHELGMNYARVLPDLIVGSCPQSASDVDHLRESVGVGSILCLQQNSDLEYFDLDLDEIIGRTEERGDIQHIRAEIRDFDPFSLRMELPLAVAKLHRAVQSGRGGAYVHCTAGLGRAPAVALAYMWWMRDFPKLEDANEVLQAVRRCGPKLFAIRAALCDILTGNPTESVTVSWRSRGVDSSVQVAGLDIGWHNKVALEKTAPARWSLSKELPVGTFYYKFVVNGDRWSYNPDAPLTQPDRDGNVNNYVEVVGSSLDASARALRRELMEDGVPLDGDLRRQVMAKIDELAASL